MAQSMQNNALETLNDQSSSHEASSNMIKSSRSVDENAATIQVNSPSSPMDLSIEKPADDDFQAKKAKAKARQQKLLNQMLNNQKAFLSNPNNKNDIESLNGKS